MSEIHPWVILFDIDGTLLTVDRNFNRPLLRNIINDLEIDYPNMESDPFSGRTDHDIITSFLVNHDRQDELYTTFKEIYLQRLISNIKREHVIRHDFIDEALRFFSTKEFIPALLTGNYPSAAYKKLKVANINTNFSFGAFGEFHKDRNMLPKLALQSVEKMLSLEIDPSKFIVIGDTPRDVQCAKSAGMKCVSVTTGKFSADELRQYQPDLILSNLSNPEKWFIELVQQ